MKYEVMACSQEVAIENGVPDEIKIIPTGLVKSQKGKFIVDEESYQLMKQTFKARGLDLVIDYEHQTLNDVQAPAGGWIKDFYLKDDAIVAKVEWTPRAKEYIANKEYRYLSPVVQVRKSDRKAILLHSVALTNTPAIDHMYLIKNSIGRGDDEMEFIEELKEFLGLQEGATEEEILAKLKEVKAASTATNDEGAQEVVANKEVLTALGVKEDAKQEDVINTIMQLKNPVKDENLKELMAFKEHYAKKEAKEKVELALKEGKLTKAQEEWAIQYALSAPKGFDEYIENAPVVVPMGEVKVAQQAKTTSIDQETIMSVNKMFGLSEEDIKKYGGGN